MPVLGSLGCGLAVLVLLVADLRGWPGLRAVAKLSASTAFVWVAWSLGALGSDYGQRVLLALMLGWLGDALLLSRRSVAFMAGLVAFLLSHLMYAAAFATSPLSLSAMAWGAGLAVLAGVVILRWLMPHTPADFKLPVLAYVVVILAMCITAAGFYGATGQLVVLAGAVLFAISDLSVARDRFVQRAFSNHLWGWPTYFGAQLLLGWSIAWVQG